MNHPTLSTTNASSVESPACVLALAVAADGRVDEREMKSLERLDAFRRIGVGRDRFAEIAGTSLEAIGSDLSKRFWLSPVELRHINKLLDAVADAERRLLVCRLAAAVLVADGRVTRDERIVYDHICTRWSISQAMVYQAIRDDRLH